MEIATYRYGMIQFFGYVIQIMPLIFLLYIPCEQEKLRFSKKKLIVILNVGCIIVSAGAAAYLSGLLEKGIYGIKLSWVGNGIFTLCMAVNGVVYFYSFKKEIKGRIFSYMLIVQYAMTLYVVSEIGIKFFNINKNPMNPYSLSAVIIYIAATILTLPAMMTFLCSKNVKRVIHVNKKRLFLISICSIAIFILTVVSLQMEAGLNEIVSSKRGQIYLSVWLTDVLVENLLLYVIYFGCLILESEKENMRTKLIAYELQNKNISNRIEKEKRRHHNLRHHFRTLSVLAQNGQLEELQKYIDGYLKDMEKIDKRQISRNPVINDVLNYYVSQSENSSIQITYDIQVKESYPFNMRDMTVLLGNAMENAVRACEEYTEGKPELNIMIRQHRQSVLIKIENSVQPEKTEVQKFEGKMRGYGLESIDMIAKKYEGSMEAWREHDRFILRVVLNIQEEREG